jgi:hypothetical protein
MTSATQPSATLCRIQPTDTAPKFGAMSRCCNGCNRPRSSSGVTSAFRSDNGVITSEAQPLTLVVLQKFAAGRAGAARARAGCAQPVSKANPAEVMAVCNSGHPYLANASCAQFMDSLYRRTQENARRFAARQSWRPRCEGGTSLNKIARSSNFFNILRQHTQKTVQETARM